MHVEILSFTEKIIAFAKLFRKTKIEKLHTIARSNYNNINTFIEKTFSAYIKISSHVFECGTRAFCTNSMLNTYYFLIILWLYQSSLVCLLL